MPIIVNYFNKRFDFGVPLEDIFPPNDINPRLKYLLEEAYKLYISNGINIEQVVRKLQGSLETRLKLKQRLIYDVHYNINVENIEETPGAYFWLIRHFLGLLPIPLLPTYSHEIHFDWISLSEKCRNFLQHYESERDRKYQLDYEFAENFNLLPFEHFLLLTILIHFIRKLSRNIDHGPQINRRSLLFLCKYYCASTCVRPYTPGYKDEKMFPLFFYIVLRWREIEKYCKTIGHPAFFLERNCLNNDTHAKFSIRNNCAQTTSFTPSVITVYKNVPYFSNNNNYLKDIGCQTEQTEYIDKGVQNLEQFAEEEKHDVKLKRAQLLLDENNSLYRLSDNFGLVDDDKHFIHAATSSPIENTIEEEKLSHNSFSFVSIEDTNPKVGGNDTVKETNGTLKKVEEYIYDDYDTFKKEENNQISDDSKNRSSFINKISKMGWSHTPENKTGRENKGSLLHKVSKIGWTNTPENSARKEESNDELENTYIKYDDVFDENGKYKTNSTEEMNIKRSALDIVFKKDNNNSKTPLCNDVPLKSTNGKDRSERKSKSNFNLRRFKLKMHFLRVLAPRKANGSSPSCDRIESNVKYKKMKNIKSNTL